MKKSLPHFSPSFSSFQTCTQLISYLSAKVQTNKWLMRRKLRINLTHFRKTTTFKTNYFISNKNFRVINRRFSATELYRQSNDDAILVQYEIQSLPKSLVN